MSETAGIQEHAEVVVVGAGPVGLMAAIELRRRGVDVCVVDSRPGPMPWAKAVGVQPRTVEVFDILGIAREALDLAIPLRGLLSYADRDPKGRLELSLPESTPYRFIALPQNHTEQLLANRLAELGGVVRRNCTVLSIAPDDAGISVTMRSNGIETACRADYLVACDGAHSVVRKSLGLDFAGDAFPETYMLADVEVDWSLPAGYSVRCTGTFDGRPDLLVCVPLPGNRRYRISMLAPPPAADTAPSAGVRHGIEDGLAPGLPEVQQVVDRLAPVPARVHTLRWSSVFRISHRLVEKYSVGRVFLAGDAAHIHPPTGGQGMNTGLQDAFNLGWKLAMVLRGRADERLLESYHAERYQVGAEVVGRTVRHARESFGQDNTTTMMLTEAQLLVGYPDSPIVGQHDPMSAGPEPGERAPDAAGLWQESTGYPLRLHELFRHPAHTLLLWAGDEAGAAAAFDLSAELEAAFPGFARSYVVVPPTVDHISGRLLHDVAGNFTAGYGFAPAPGSVQSYLVRPDGYIAHRSGRTTSAMLARYLRTAYGVPGPGEGE